jgi:hypothetical protein
MAMIRESLGLPSEVEKERWKSITNAVDKLNQKTERE